MLAPVTRTGAPSTRRPAAARASRGSAKALGSLLAKSGTDTAGRTRSARAQARGYREALRNRLTGLATGLDPAAGRPSAASSPCWSTAPTPAPPTWDPTGRPRTDCSWPAT
jgi:hypothetical protein